MSSAAEATELGALIASVRRSPVLGELDEAAVGALFRGGTRRRFAPDSTIVVAGDRSTAAYVVASGRVDVFRPAGRVTLEAPALVGEVAALTDTPRSATVVAADDVEAIEIARAHFMEAIRRSPAAMQALTLLVGERLCRPDVMRHVGRYEIDEAVACGPGGRVLKARHPVLGIPVCLKMLSHALALSPGSTEAFLREASVLAQLDHPNVVRILDAFPAHDTYFIVMPWLEGTTVEEMIRSGLPIDEELVLSVADGALAALVAVHEAGLVHRDVKPANLYRCATGRVLLIDFGVACARGEASPEGLAGSVSYCSPEQILSRATDGRADVYSLACVVYEMAFGRPPFVGEEVDEVLSGHLRTPPDFGAPARCAIGPALRRWLARCLTKTRGERPDAAQARAALPRVGPRRSV